MEQLIEIKTVPLVLEYQTQHARLDYTAVKPTYEMTRARGSLDIAHRYPQLNIDTTELRASMNMKTMTRFTRDNAEAGMQAAMDATAQLAEEGNALMNTDVATLIYNQNIQDFQDCMDTVMVAVPSVPADISWTPGEFSMRYTADRLMFDWTTRNTQKADFTPADIEFRIKQYPRIEFVFHGKPNYVPPSASPDYVPSKIDVSA